MAGWKFRRQAQVSAEPDIELESFFLLRREHARDEDDLVEHDGIALQFKNPVSHGETLRKSYDGHYSSRFCRLPVQRPYRQSMLFFQT
jgi:hypothetical protein